MRFRVHLAFAICLFSTLGCGQNRVDIAAKRPTVAAKLPGAKSPSANGTTLDRVRHIISEQMGTKIEALSPETSLADLKADELDFVELVMELEEAFDISIPDDRAERLAGGDVPAGFKQVTVRTLAALVDELSSKRPTTPPRTSAP